MRKLMLTLTLAPMWLGAQAPQIPDTVTLQQNRTATNAALAALYSQITAGVTSVAGRTGAITLSQSDIVGLVTALGLKAPLSYPIFTGQPTISDFTLAPHSHLDPVGGGTLDAAAITTGAFGIARMAAGAMDTVLQGGGGGAAPSFVSLPNCGDSNHAMAYSTSTHSWSCQSIGGGSSNSSGSPNQTCTFAAGATACSITYATALSDAAIASDPFCVYTNTTPYPGFIANGWTKSTTDISITFLPAPNPGACSVNTSGDGGGSAGATYTPGSGLILAGNQLSTDPATIPTFLTGTSSLTFSSITTLRCNAMTFALTGAGTGDSIAPGWPSTLEAGLAGTMRVSAPNSIEVQLCNLTGATMTPAAGQTFRATIVRSF